MQVEKTYIEYKHLVSAGDTGCGDGVAGVVS